MHQTFCSFVIWLQTKRLCGTRHFIHWNSTIQQTRYILLSPQEANGSYVWKSSILLKFADTNEAQLVNHNKYDVNKSNLGEEVHHYKGSYTACIGHD